MSEFDKEAEREKLRKRFAEEDEPHYFPRKFTRFGGAPDRTGIVHRHRFTANRQYEGYRPQSRRFEHTHSPF